MDKALLKPLRTSNKRQRVAAHKFQLLLLIAPLLLLALPLGLSNSLAQPLAILFLLPWLIKTTPISTQTILIVVAFLFLLSNSWLQLQIHPFKEYSSYQALRSSLPFLVICLIVGNYETLLKRTIALLDTKKMERVQLVDKLVFLFSVLCAMQTISYLAGIPLANALSAALSAGRVMIFQSTSCVLLIYYTASQKKYFSLFLLILVILGSGSKALLVASFLALLLAFINEVSVRRILQGVVAVGIFVSSVAYINPLAFDRLTEFAAGDRGVGFEDKTRAYEISEAKKTLLSNEGTLLFGAGFLMQLSPGVATGDPSWRENSKYDIENGYWGVLAKLGIVFTGILVIFLMRSLPWNNVSLVILMVELIMFFKTSYQIFCYFDGVYLLVWSLVVSAMIKLKRSET